MSKEHLKPLIFLESNTNDRPCGFVIPMITMQLDISNPHIVRFSNPVRIIRGRDRYY